MKLKLFKSLWEYVEFVKDPLNLTITWSDDIERRFREISNAGYSGIEAPLPVKDREADFRSLLQRYRLDYIAQVITRGDHQASFAVQAERVDKACARAIHIHGRVGYAEGPQVADPRAPEYAKQTEAHFRWWEQICQQLSESHAAEITFTPELCIHSHLPGSL